ncbi:MAG TPA: linear amide C-N hydrolase [Dysgonomonas sp.]|uniref:linear amide C-N hydrolase n=1 Tax=unclassified Dysgonomonas TaxID=2630389 RepID=UPI0025C33F08|nr:MULTISPECIES: linear amide C-N hydrolase [unclassified Dysgonomonas]HML65828.1 linear amide C-N hydrolase [Dysgonomonas sp.]
MKRIYLFIVGFISLVTIPKANACTRVVYTGDNGMVVTGRTMDWKTEMHSNIWVFPRGMERSGETGSNSLKWTSKYGSVVTSAFEIASTDGMNEKGLVANLLWLNESVYPAWDKSKPGLTIAAWVQYMLDNFASVDEAVSFVGKNSFQVVSDKMPDGSRLATLHLAISDATGDSAIFEYIDGKLNIYHSKDYNVMTNSPTYDKQLALNDYWKSIGGLTFLPGTNRAADRFARASFYIDALPKIGDEKLAVASIFSVIRNASVPYGISTPDSPEISTTQWRTVSDSKNLTYFFESSLTPNTFWVNLQDMNLSKGAPVLKLSLANGETYNGNTINNFKVSQPFKFLGVND